MKNLQWFIKWLSCMQEEEKNNNLPVFETCAFASDMLDIPNL